MPELDPAPDADQDDADYLTDTYTALDEDQHRQRQQAQSNAAASPEHAHGTDSEPVQPTVSVAADPVNEQEPESITSAEIDQTDSTAEKNAAESAAGPGRRVFIIDGKEYPDPDGDLPITGARSVQALYRDYFPGQLDNADVVEKSRPDGTLEVTFKRRIGTKGTSRRRRSRGGLGEVVVTAPGVARVLAALPADRPLAWDLVEQAVDSTGAVRLDYVPPPDQLNLAEAQQTARVRLIEHAVGELRRLRPSG